MHENYLLFGVLLVVQKKRGQMSKRTVHAQEGMAGDRQDKQGNTQTNLEWTGGNKSTLR